MGRSLCTTALNDSGSSDPDRVPLRWHLRRDRTMSLLHVGNAGKSGPDGEWKVTADWAPPPKGLPCLSRTNPTI